MKDIFPFESLQSKFENEVQFSVYTPSEIDIIAKLEPDCLYEIGANAWMHYVESGAKVDRFKLSEHFDARNPFLFKEVERVIKRKVIQNILLVYADVNDNTLSNKRCSECFLARTYPNNLHISDIEFSNPYQPVPEEKRKYMYHEYRGLGIFSELLQSIIKFGVKERISKITLSAASSDQVPYFESHGFTVEKTKFAQEAIQMGLSIPMERPCI